MSSYDSNLKCISNNIQAFRVKKSAASLFNIFRTSLSSVIDILRSITEHRLLTLWNRDCSWPIELSWSVAAYGKSGLVSRCSLLWKANSVSLTLPAWEQTDHQLSLENKPSSSLGLEGDKLLFSSLFWFELRWVILPVWAEMFQVS